MNDGKHGEARRKKRKGKKYINTVLFMRKYYLVLYTNGKQGYSKRLQQNSKTMNVIFHATLVVGARLHAILGWGSLRAVGHRFLKINVLPFVS